MIERKDIVGVLLAAGQSKRFGSNKCLKKLPNGNEIALQSALNLQPHLDQIICVIPDNDKPIKVLFEQNGFQTIENKNADEGISTSIKLAVETTKFAKAWLICLADMPNIDPDSYASIISAIQKNHSIVIPRFNNRRGNPVGLSSANYEEILQLKGDVGAKQIFKRQAANIHFVDVADQGIIQDIDTEDDLISLSTI